MYYVYILRSTKQPYLYVGSTNDIDRRLTEHNRGLSKSTSPYRPFILIAYVAVTKESKARELEKYFKRGSGKTLLKKRILNDEDLAEYEVGSET